MSRVLGRISFKSNGNTYFKYAVLVDKKNGTNDIIVTVSSKYYEIGESVYMIFNREKSQYFIWKGVKDDPSADYQSDR